MASYLYVQTLMSIPGVGTSNHIAELEPINATECLLHRLLEVDPANAVCGAARGKTVVGMAAPPHSTVPHPESYADFPDIEASYLSSEEFEALWSEAVAKFPEIH
ncbi:hypothetical protein [Corynebacterium pseudotuberculosis]|uniref:Uncharacterized protein n=1 Tax=Corynebacterium pseudotuberculosis (strain C231) TaxID=681645 RepID=D9QDE8_CORP2|nr:hypothetical protein [Corynebacterium pseudotuberculosis]ADK29884.1 hypothetical protein CPFRC_10560 [Corynebacterium pseudotuberculosis FRC41]ADL11533.1 hypothetical protein CPC231_10545 [Corynebacterium pseudotuberculosis C231]ADL21946.1 hypothetical protein CP1002_10540 [Corynebacterium pseudotuberculosis 1002]ADO27343.1 hypothetical protein CPI19_10565 [Corynebacterium pseudotuberculosis I19]AEK93404.1 Hypothetical protein CpPAT10_2094 [Corynebacterium pseudotuberculosis PAT10]